MTLMDRKKTTFGKRVVKVYEEVMNKLDFPGGYDSIGGEDFAPSFNEMNPYNHHQTPGGRMGYN